MSEQRLHEVEAAYLSARSARDRLDVARARGEPADRTALARAAAAAFEAVRAAFERLRDEGRPLDAEDRRAVVTMLAGLEQAERYLLPGVVLDDEGPSDAGPDGAGPSGAGPDDAGPDGAAAADAGRDRAGEAAPGSREAEAPPATPVPPARTGTPDARAGASVRAWNRGASRFGPDDFTERRLRLETSFALAAEGLVDRRRPITRLQVLARIAAEPDGERRRELFLALEPLWRSIDGDGGADSPYRALIARSALRWRSGRSPVEANAKALGVTAADITAWAMTVLAGWRAAFVEPARARGEAPVEPWDWWWRAGEAHRQLAPALPFESLEPVNRAYHAMLGADLDELRVLFDLRARPGRPTVPVAYTTFGERPHRRADGTWSPGRPVVMETLTDGGLGELSELVHETGHAIHLAGIRTRPAFADWPDSDALTEALGDILALDVFEPAWQRRWLPGGASVSPQVAVRARYAEIALDAAWALFEIRLHEAFERRPNDLWTEITSTWLGIAPHPEWSWWAMRGQLVEEPGYMVNYAIGAVLAADLRAATRAARGDWIDGDPGWYEWVREHVYRFGLERPAREVLDGVLGRPPSADALLAQVARAGSG